MVDVTLVLELHRLAPIDIAIGAFTVGDTLQGFVNDAVDCDSQREVPAGEVLVGERTLQVSLAHVDQLDHFAEDFTELDE